MVASYIRPQSINVHLRRNKMKRVLIQGAYDILNAGHVRALKRAKGLGDYLIVALNTDELYAVYKGNGYSPYIPFKQRREILESVKWVDEVVPAHHFSPISLLERHNIDVYVLTREWETTKEVELAFMKKKGGEISWSPRYKNIYCSSDIRKRIIRRCLSKRGVR